MTTRKRHISTPGPRHWMLILALVLTGCGGESTPGSNDESVAEAFSAPPEEAPLPTRADSKPAPIEGPQTLFWRQLSTLCNQSYAGFLTVGTEESDRSFGEADLKIHVSYCSENEIHMPFHVSEDRSRTFILRRVNDELTLHHRHRDESGAAADPDGYGGATQNDGSSSRQDFKVDEATVAALPETQYNVWAIEIEPGNYLAYELQRPEEDRYFRVEFDLAETIDTPPPPWGDERQ